MGDAGLFPAINLLAFVLCVVFLAYVTLILVAYLGDRPQPPGDAGALDWHLVLPCLDEEAVIERTVRLLARQFPLAHIWCVDDASTDRTREILGMLQLELEHLQVLTRAAPDAQVGKGAALNAAWQQIRAQVAATGRDPEKVVVGVVDADGELDPACFATLAGATFFGDADIAAVQVAVRISNRSAGPRPQSSRWWRRLLVDLQDLEFVGPIGAMQLLRRRTGSVSMGGNGQFSRLSVLNEIATWAGTPWHGALLEDFELGLHVLLTGRSTAYCHQSWVAQEGLPSVRALVRQRSRWSQGSMQCVQYLRPVLASPRIGHVAAFEICYFLVLPWLQLLGTAVYAIAYCILAWYLVTVGISPSAWLQSGQWAVLPLLLLTGIGPFFVWGPVYRQRVERTTTRRRAVLLGFSLFVYSNLHAIASWWAFVRYLNDRDDWKKTDRLVAAPSAIGGPTAGTQDAAPAPVASGDHPVRYVPRRTDPNGVPARSYAPTRSLSDPGHGPGPAQRHRTGVDG